MRLVGRSIALSEASPTVEIFRGVRECPTHEGILNTLGAFGRRAAKPKLPINYVVRDRAHLEGWLEAFLRVEKEQLKERFARPDKDFETVVLANEALGQVDVVFRLSTLGVGGHTEYRINIIKVNEDEYICIE